MNKKPTEKDMPFYELTDEKASNYRKIQAAILTYNARYKIASTVIIWCYNGKRFELGRVSLIGGIPDYKPLTERTLKIALESVAKWKHTYKPNTDMTHGKGIPIKWLTATLQATPDDFNKILQVGSSMQEGRNNKFMLFKYAIKNAG